MSRRTEKAKATKNSFIEKEVVISGYDVVVSLAKATDNYPCIAFGEIRIPDLFYIKIRVIEKKDSDDIFISFPQTKSGDTWKTLTAPMNAETYNRLINTAEKIVDELYKD